MWARGEYEKSLSWLRTFSGRLADDLGLDLDNPTERVQEVRGMPKMSEYISLLARCYLKQGEWQSDLKDDWNPVRFYNTVCYPYCLTRSNKGQHS